MLEQFSAEESEILKTFCSNGDKGIFVLQNLPEVIKGALFSRYSRSTKSLRRLLLDEFIRDPETGFAEIVKLKHGSEGMGKAVQKAQAFYDRVLDGYGDDSVGELGGAHVACEQISIIATKVLQDARLGGSPLEKSTRYVYFNDKKDGQYQFLREPTLMQSPFAGAFTDTCNMLFETYSALIEPMKGFLTQHLPLEEFDFFDTAAKQTVKFHALTDEKIITRATIAYQAAIRSKACDVLRGLLPAATLTNMGVFGNGRFFQSLLTKLHSHPLAELRAIGKEMHAELNTIIPSFVRRAKPDEFLVESDIAVRARTLEHTHKTADQSPTVTLVDYDPAAEEKIMAAMLYVHSALPLMQLRKIVQGMGNEAQQELLAGWLGRRIHRRDKPGRAFENSYYTFDILADYGIYRDLQRHRILTQERQLLTTRFGYNVPEEITIAGFADQYHAAMRAAAETYEKIAVQYPFEAQYVVPLAYNIRWYMTMNLREAFHFCELRATQQGHPGYRKVAQLMAKEIARVHPHIGQLQFVDYREYKLERIAAEMRTAEKREAREGK